MQTSKVTSKGQIVIPAPLRRKLGFEEGVTVVVTEADGGGVQVRPLNRSYFEEAAGFLSGEGRAADTLLETREEDRAREDRRS